MSLPTDIANDLIAKLDSLINSSDSEQLLLASKTVTQLKDILSINLTREALQPEIKAIKTDSNFSYSDFKSMIDSAFNKVGYFADKIKNPTDYLLLTKTLVDISKNAAAFVLTYEPVENQDTLINDIRAKYDKYLNTLLETMEAKIPLIDNTEDAVLAANAISSTLQLNLEAGNYNRLMNMIGELSSSNDLLATQMRKSSDSISKNLDNDFNQLSDDLNTHIQARNPHRVDKEYLGLDLVPNYPASSDVENDSNEFLSTAKATNTVWQEAIKPRLEDAPSDGEYYLRKDSKWVRGLEVVPIGTILPYSGKTAPMGWLWLESDTIYTKLEYPKLYEHLKTNCPHLIIDTDTFKLCSSEGMFFRGYDPNAKVDPDGGRELLTEQGDVIRNITGDGFMGSYSGALLPDTPNHKPTGAIIEKRYSQTGFQSSNSASAQYTFDASRVVPTSSENRPKNLNCLWIIKAFDHVSDPVLLQSEEVVNKVNSNYSDVKYIMNNFGGRKNILINGDFQVWQRGSEFTSGNWCADRWWVAFHQGGKAKIDSDVPMGYGHSLHLESTLISFGQTIEIPANGREFILPNDILTLSGWYKGEFLEKINFELKYRNAKFSAENEKTFLIIEENDINATTEWKKFIIKFKTNGINPSNTLLLLETSGINGWAKFYGLQLEVGDKATAFERLSFTNQLLLCQRFYGRYRNGFEFYNQGVASIYFHFPTMMRVNPTLKEVTRIGGHGDAELILESHGNSSYWHKIRVGSSMTAYRMSIIEADAEL